MARPVSNQIKTTLYRQTQKNGDIYIYERKRLYHHDTRKTETISCSLTGKIKKGTTKIIPTRPRRKLGSNFTDEDISTRVHVGLTDILEWIGCKSGIDEDIKHCMSSYEAAITLTIVRYWIANFGHALSHFEKWQILHPTPFKSEGIVTEKMYHRLFERIGFDENIVQKYFHARGERMGRFSALALDSTTISTYSKNQIEARQGFNKAHDGLDTIKLITLYDIKTGQPVAYTKQPGNIPDVIGVENALKQLSWLDIENVQIVTDNGYYSTKNIDHFLSRHVKFLTLAQPSIKWIKEMIQEKKEELNSFSSTCPWDTGTHGVTVLCNRTFDVKGLGNDVVVGDTVKQHRIYVHIFYNQTRRAAHAQEFMNHLFELKYQIESGEKLTDVGKGLAETYFEIKSRKGKIKANFKNVSVDEAIGLSGYFVLVGNKTMQAFEALKLYRLRERVEEGFRIEKNLFDGSKPRVWTPDVLRGRMFCQFVALGYYFYLHRAIERIKSMPLGEKNGDKEHDKQENLKLEKNLRIWLQSKSYGQILDWFDCVELTSLRDGRKEINIRSANTSRDKLFLNLLGIKK